MSDFDAAVAISNQRIRTRIDFAILGKLRQQEKTRSQAVVGLIEQAARAAERMRSQQPHLGRRVDLSG